MRGGAPRRRGAVIAAAAVAVLSPATATAQSESPPSSEAGPVVTLPAVEVIGTTPLPGFGLPLKDVPANVQVFGGRELQRQRPTDVTQFLDQNANSVSAGSGQGNMYQQDLNFRGFAASPLLGTPQGLSVFQDGVRINEAFADVVNWDLLPPSAIADLQLIPGSNPIFGLNTLGGALAIHTKSGAQYPGGAVEVSGGSFGRVAATVEYGVRRERMDGFITANLVDDNGWAEHNPSRIRQLFAKVGYQADGGDIDTTVSLADNTLQGAQTLPQSFLDTPRQAYTWPDRNENRLAFFTVNGTQALEGGSLVSGNAYYRSYRSTNFSSNVNDGYGSTDPDTGAVAQNEAFNDQSSVNQRSWGAALQVTTKRQVAGRSNQFSVGAGADFGSIGFQQAAQTADFTADRGTVATGDFAPETDVAMKTRYLGLYATDTLNVTSEWTLTLSGRYNTARIEIADRSGSDPGLDGTHSFSRFNPAAGVNWSPSPNLTAWAAYNEGMRAPTAIELTCSDAAAPCKLPNLFLADPPLAMVVAKTWEAGARGRFDAGTTWSVAVYRTDLVDDIQFVASGEGAVNAGFFQNVGNTRRQGLEFAGATRLGDVALTLRYSHLEATFRSNFTSTSPNNSSADAAGTIVINPGDRIPGIPANTAKLRAEYAPGDRWSVAANVVGASSQYARGDENNQDKNGRIPGYLVVSVDAQYQVLPALQVFAQISNLFDRAYQNFGLLGSNFFTGPGRTFGPSAGIAPVSEQFRAVGSPRGMWVGLRYTFDRPQGRT
jgi:outer membrane receptor protein involved in Fe transport